MGKVVEIDCEKSIKLETSRNVTKSKRSLHWCRSISKKYMCTFYYSISKKSYYIIGQEVYYSIGRFITLSGSYYIIGRFLLHYRAVITVSGVYYIIGWYKYDADCHCLQNCCKIARLAINFGNPSKFTMRVSSFNNVLLSCPYSHNM